MKRLLPHPVLALTLLAVWLLLTQSVSPGQILLGAAVALLASQALAALGPPSPRFGRLQPIWRLMVTVAGDVVRSNLAVARIILHPRRARIAGFVSLPLELASPHGLAVLALIITATPGTLWVDLDRRNGTLLIHVLDLVDEEEWISLIKRRYEALLLEIFHDA